MTTAVPCSPLPDRGPRRLDAWLVAAVVLLGFLLAFFPVRNSDFWQHLAAGRLLAAGGSAFGVDPFAHTTEDVYWTNHAWLFDLTLYHLFQAGGGLVVVAGKALLVAGLAWLMLRLRRPDRPAWPAFVCVLAALLACTPRLLVQPAGVSCLLLAALLLVLVRAPLSRQVWLAPLLCVLWVNLDAWFLLGPLVVALFWLSGGISRKPDEDGPPGWLILVCLAACVCNPHHVHAFQLPDELSLNPAVRTLCSDPRFRSLFAHAWQVDFSLRPSWAALATASAMLLFGLGVLSFLLAGKQTAWRFLVWAVFAALAAWQVRLLPFFAVVAAPIAALNLQDVLPATGSGRRAVAGQLVLLAGCLLLMLAAAPTWLLFPGSPDFGAGVEPNPSLLRSVRTLHAWRQAGRLSADEVVLAVHPDVAHYWAWFCPEERGFLDHRFSLFGSAADDFEQVSSIFYPDVGGSAKVGEAVLQSRGIRWLVLYDPDPSRLGRVLHRLEEDRRRWQIISIDGQALLVRRSGPDDSGPSPYRFSPDRLAFTDQEYALPPAPGEGPAAVPASVRLLYRFGRFAPPPAWESVAAAVYLRLFEEQAPRAGREMQRRLWSRLAAGAVGQSEDGWAGALGTLACLAAPETWLAPADRPSAALALLAVRAARRAVAVAPQDAAAWLVLARAYASLGAVTGDAEQGGPHAPLPRLRHVQTAAALHAALAVNPELEPAHAALADLYARRDYLDAALPHLQAQVQLARRSKSSPSDRVAALEQAAEELEKRVQDRQHQFTVQTSLPGGPNEPLGQARLAVRLGLPARALQLLERSSVVLIGSAGARLELELLLLLGRVSEAGERLDDPEMRENQHKLGAFDWPVLDSSGQVHVYRLPAYEWLQVWRAAARGDYSRTAALLDDVIGRLQAEEANANLPLLRQALAATTAAEVLARCPPQAGVLYHLANAERRRLTDLYRRAALLSAEQADLQAVAAVLALERGDVADASRRLARSLQSREAFLLAPRAREYQQRLAHQRTRSP